MSYRIASKRYTTTILCIRTSRMTDIRWPYSMAQPVDNRECEHHFLFLSSRMDINKSCIKDWKCLRRYLIQVTRHIIKCGRMYEFCDLEMILQRYIREWNIEYSWCSWINTMYRYARIFFLFKSNKWRQCLFLLLLMIIYQAFPPSGRGLVNNP